MTVGRIYSITNKLNGKQYIGQTAVSLEERFRMHCVDAKKERNRDRKLYCAMSRESDRDGGGTLCGDRGQAFTTLISGEDQQRQHGCPRTQ